MNKSMKKEKEKLEEGIVVTEEGKGGGRSFRPKHNCLSPIMIHVHILER
jgi:hypothetical protein